MSQKNALSEFASISICWSIASHQIKTLVAGNWPEAANGSQFWKCVFLGHPVYLKKLSQLIPLRSMAYSTFDKVLLKRELREAAGMNALLGNRYWSNEFKAGLLICNSDIPVGEICFWFTNVLFPCYLNVEYDERISCWNPFQNLLTWSIPLNFMTSSTTSDCSQLAKSRVEYFIKEKKNRKRGNGESRQEVLDR